MADSPDYRCVRADRCSDRVKLEDQPDQECLCNCHGMAGAYATCDVEGGCGHLHRARRASGKPRYLGAAIEQSRGLCERCAAKVAKAIRELPLDYTELNFLLSSGSSGLVDVVVRSTRDLPVPIRLSVAALQTSICRTAEMWAHAVANQLGIRWDARRVATSRPGATLQRASQLLGNGLGTLLALPPMPHRHHASGHWTESDGLAGALELLELHSLVRFAAGRTKLIHRLPAPCPRCERMTLVRHNGEDHVECQACPPSAYARWSESDYKRLVLILAEDYREAA